MKVEVIRWNFSNNLKKKRGLGYLSIAVASGIRAAEAKLGVLGGRASGKEDGNAEKGASHVWKNKKKEQAGWTFQQTNDGVDCGQGEENHFKKQVTR